VRKPTAASALEHVREICLALPGTTEKISHGEPAYFLKSGQYLYFLDNHHGDGRLAVWLAAPPGMQESLIESDPQHFFRPPYVGVRGWVGINLNTGLEWSAIAALIAEGHRFIEAKRKKARR
jgi:predicted DNA-binding protein (MmcQ/YjbR family)